jgi:hypothetical protein
MKNEIFYDVFYYLDLFEVSLVYMIVTHLVARFVISATFAIRLKIARSFLPRLLLCPPFDNSSLLAAFVDLGKEGLEHSLLETSGLIDVGNTLTDLADDLLLVVEVALLELEIVI